ncbi:MAG: MFS transporter [Pseudomonadota bacterium]
MSGRQYKLRHVEIAGYGAGDFGFNLYWTTLASYLAAFYTDVFGLTAAAAATMILVTRIVDAVTDPIMGAVADRTRTRLGKYRPYLLFGGIPLAIAGVLAFTTPEYSDTGKLIWAYATYTVLMLCYTVVNTPYSALSGVMTNDSTTRTGLNAARFVFAFACGAFVNKYTLPLVDYFGDGDAALGWQKTMVLYGAVAIPLFWVTFFSAKERIQPPKAKTAAAKQDILDLLRNKPWIILFLLSMLVMMTVTMRGGSAYYYFHYYLERPDLLGNYLLSQSIAYAAGAIAAPFLTVYIDKAKLLMILMGLVGLFSVAFAFVPADQIELIFTLNILISLAMGPKSPITWSMYADSADYNEWRVGRRATAMTFAAATFAQKLGGSIGAAMMLSILGWLGYAAKQAQSEASLQGINLLQTLLPGVFALLAMVAVSRYALTREKLADIQADLEARDASK